MPQCALQYEAMKSRLRNVLWKRDAEENRRKKLEDMHAHKARWGGVAAVGASAGG